MLRRARAWGRTVERTRIAAARPLGLAFALASALAPASARADGGPYDGKWKQGPLREDYTLPQWIPGPSGCGPAPVSATTGGGELVQVAQDGDELTVSGGGRTFKTNQCYDPLTTLQRDTHSRDPAQHSWRTRCVTPPSDPRRATMNTLVIATSDSHIDVLETGRYEIQVTGGRCIADVQRSRSFDLVSRDANATAPPPPVPLGQGIVTAVPPPSAAAHAVNTCDSPGDPQRLEVRPSRKLLRTGESFTLHAVVKDASGCAVPSGVSWSVASGATANVNVDPQGRVTATTDSPDGSATITVTAAGRAAKVTVDVASPAHYADLLARSGLDGAGESDAVAVAETGSIAGGSARAEDTAKTRRTWFLAIVGGIAVLLAALALVLGRRAKKATALEKRADDAYEERVRAATERRAAKKAAHDAQVRAHEQSLKSAKDAAARAKLERERAQNVTVPTGPSSAARNDPGALSPLASSTAPTVMLCPTCRREYPMSSQFCPQDATRLVPFNAAQPAPAGMICPACKRGFPAGTRACTFDGEELVPYAMHAAVPRPGTGTMLITAKGKICPTCGGRFDGNAAFCGKDGTALVLIN